MKSKNDIEQSFQSAKKQVRRIKMFYLHLAFYIIFVGLIALNFYVMSGPYVNVITGLNITILVLWSAIVGIHAWKVFKGRFLFKKSWEDKKTEQFLEKEEEVETTIWE